MENRDAHTRRNPVRAALVALALVVVSLMPPAAWAFSSDTSGNATTYSGFTANRGNVGRYALGVASDGTILVNSGARHPVAGGGSIPINLSGGIPKANAGAAIGRFLLKGLGVVGVLQLGVAAYDLAKELGFTVDNSSGDLVVIQDVAGYGYRRSGTQPNGQPWPLRSSILLVCHDIMGSTLATNGFLRSVIETFPTHETISIGCAWPALPGGNTYGALRYTSSTPTPSDLDALTDAIAAKSGWPTGSAISRTVADAIKSGESLDVGTPTVTGPATSPGEKRTTTKPDGTVVTTQTTNNFNYNTNVVTVTQTTTTTTYNPSTGTTETETTETEPEPEEYECAKNPDSLACAEADVPDGEIPRDTETVTYEEENLFGAGSCPANLTASVATLGQTVTVWDWQRTCDLALPLRALVLSLATFAALLIVMPEGAKS